MPPKPISEYKDYGTPDRWFVLSLLALDYFTLYLHRNLINYLQPPIESDLGLSETQLGLLHWGFLVTYALSQVFVGYLGDRFRRRTVLLTSLIISTVALASMGLANNFAQLFTWRVILAMAQSASVPAIAGIMADCFTSRSRSRAVSFYLLSSPFSIVTAGWLGGKVADLAGWRYAMFFFAAMGLAIGAVLILLLREPIRTERKAGQGLGDAGGSLPQTLLSVLRTPTFLLLAIAYVLVANVTQLTLFWLPRYCGELFDMKLAGAGRMSTLWVQMGVVCGLFAGGVWADRWARQFMGGRFSVQLIGLLVCIPALGVMGLANTAVELRIAMTVFGFASWLYFSNLWTSTFEVVDPAARSTAIGLLNVASGVLGAWVSPFVGYLRETGVVTNLGNVFVGTAVMSLAAACLIGLIVLVSLKRDYRGPLRSGPPKEIDEDHSA